MDGGHCTSQVVSVFANDDIPAFRFVSILESEVVI